MPFLPLNRWSIQTYFFVLTLILPAIVVIVFAFGAQGETLEHIKETILADVVLNTLYVLLGTVSVASIFGIGGAYLTTFYSFKMDKLFSFLLAMPFIVPAYIIGFIYGDIFGFYGPVHIFIMQLGFKNYIDVLNGYMVVFIMGLALYPYVYLIVKASFSKTRSTILYPAINLGATRTKIFFRLIIPLSRVSIIGALTLVVMECISEYGVMKFYGVDTLSTAIFNAWFGLNDPQSAAYISSIAMIFVVSVLLIEKAARGKISYKSEKSSAKIPKEKLGFIAGTAAYLFLLIPITFGFLIPFLWTLYYSAVYAENIIDMEYVGVMLNTVAVAGVSSILIVFGAIFVSYSARIFPYGINKYSGKIASLGYALPGAVIGVGILILFSSIDNWLIAKFNFESMLIGGTVFALIFGYCARFFAVAINTVDGSFERIGITVNKAARSLGASHIKTLLKIELPLMKRAMLFAFVLAFVDIVKELPLTLILRPFNYETLATKTYEMVGSQMMYESSIYVLSIMVAAFIPLFLTILKKEY